nr:MAG: hypothetical protein [Marsupenaeus japonicus endogenous nimavirus]
MNNRYIIPQRRNCHIYQDETDNVRSSIRSWNTLKSNNWRLKPQWYPWNKDDDGGDCNKIRQYASGWQQLINDHRIYRNFRKSHKMKHWKNASDEKEGIVEMVNYLNGNHSYEKVLHEHKNSTNDKIRSCESQIKKNDNQKCKEMVVSAALSSSLLSPSSSLEPPSLAIPNEGSVKVINLSSHDREVFAKNVRNVGKLSYQGNYILYLAVLVFLFLRESSLITPTDLYSMFNSPFVKAFLKRLVILLQYEKKAVATCIIVYNVERVTHDLICDFYT